MLCLAVFHAVTSHIVVILPQFPTKNHTVALSFLPPLHSGMRRRIRREKKTKNHGFGWEQFNTMAKGE